MDGFIVVNDVNDVETGIIRDDTKAVVAPLVVAALVVPVAVAVMLVDRITTTRTRTETDKTLRATNGMVVCDGKDREGARQRRPTEVVRAMRKFVRLIRPPVSHGSFPCSRWLRSVRVALVMRAYRCMQVRGHTVNH